jgi:hypothetical protein
MKTTSSSVHQTCLNSLIIQTMDAATFRDLETKHFGMVGDCSNTMLSIIGYEVENH